MAVCPPFTALEATARAASGSPLRVLAQAVHEAASGAHTGEVSAPMIVAAGADGTLVGHSERRAAGETDAQVAARVRAALDAGLLVMLCVGESLEQREAGETESWLTGQVRAALAGVRPDEVASLAIAYEPIWAIGTGRTATPEIAQEACAHVRARRRRAPSTARPCACSTAAASRPTRPRRPDGRAGHRRRAGGRREPRPRRLRRHRARVVRRR